MLQIMRGWGSTWLVGASILASIAGCERGATTEAPARQAELIEAHTGDAKGGETDARKDGEREGLIIGEAYRLPANAVVDGDTIRVEGIEGSLRLLSVDTEEKLRAKADRAAAAKDFEKYLAGKRGDRVRPGKPGTPMGERASEFAQSFFEGSEVVRLERDDPKEIRGYYGRLLAYVLVRKRGRWTSYNLEAVRAGMSPYFTKYGYSHRFHKDFVHAEADAREAKRGIWSPDAEGYGDYDERTAWWNARADFIRAFEHQANGRDDYIQMTHWDALTRLEASLGKTVAVLSTVDKIQRFKGLVRVSLARQRGSGFPIIFFDNDVFARSGIEKYWKEPVVVRGNVERYKKGDYETLQIVVRDPKQVTLPDLPWPEGATKSDP